jgi:ribonuclease HI
MTTVIYTDGACSMGVGGWAWYHDDHTFAWGHERDTTNQRMEMKAVIMALEAYAWGSDALLIVTDSAYVVNCFADGWHRRWRQNSWTTRAGTVVKNRDLWEELLTAYETYSGHITFRHMRGHGRGGPADALHVAGNAAADRLAVQARLALARHER